MHIVDTLLAEGQMVHVSLDWTQRFDFMQQHTGESAVRENKAYLFKRCTAYDVHGIPALCIQPLGLMHVSVIRKTAPACS